MTLSPEAQAWRARKGRPPRPPRDGERFKPRNAIVHGGWLAALKPREVLVWLVLDTLADPRGVARIGGSRLGELAGLARENALRATASLVRLGLVERVERGRSGRGSARTSNVYRLLVPAARSTPSREEVN